jgi:hypothetical protein
MRRRSEASPSGGKNIESDQSKGIVALRKEPVNESALATIIDAASG